MTQKIPLVLILCGSFNPITNMHLRMFEIAKNYFNSSEKYNVVSGIVSPVSDGYKKKGLLEAKNRCEMVSLALKSNNWVKLSKWESENPNWTPTLEVLNYHNNHVQNVFGQDTRLMLLCGSDIIDTFIVPTIWKPEHIDQILKNYGVAVINRTGYNSEKVIYESDLLYKHKNNIHLITDWIVNDISSTKIRRAVSRNESVRYLVQDEVNDYILKNKLYQNSL